ncbi:tRNA pseudouridine synthase-like 1 isoform X2 [Aricia agestis]|nr:tRNA pseudouridine synthase-like 1 isoform X2 [Aricia agestis]
MESALLKLRPKNYPNLTLSSRTDGGVHALNASAHFDIVRKTDTVYDGQFITYNMNKHFMKNDISIFVKNCIRVNDTFSARYNAIRRTYLYRLAVIKPSIKLNERESIIRLIPIEEWKRCHFIRASNFDIALFKEASKYFVGYHDFTTFKKFDKLKETKSNRRDIFEFNIKPGTPCVTSYSQNRESYFDHWDIEIKGRGFVHNQIRRMIGALITVAIGKLEPESIKLMLQIPSKHSWHHHIQTGPPDGLYLCNVEYNPEDLVYTEGRTFDEVKSDCDE